MPERLTPHFGSEQQTPDFGPKRQKPLLGPEQQKQHFAFIECVRGYAIVLIIICHTTYLVPELPYPVHRIAVLGWHGVQLFFLASAVTLMMSWHHEKARDGSIDVSAFFLRRLFRIAPAYYLASILYFWLDPPRGGFDAVQAAASYLFINAWHPALMGVTPEAWSVVPGGWSIGVEFTFYAAFPVLACYITSLSRAIYLFVGTLLVGAMLNALVWPSLQASFGTVPADNFLYFWFPNQMSVFALGLCLFFLLQRGGGSNSILAAHPDLIAAASAVIVASTAFVAAPHWLDLLMPVPPTFLLVSLALALFILALAQARPGVFINGPVALMGRVSFSAYLLHAAVLEIVSATPLLRHYLDATGWSAIAAFAVALTGILPIVLACSWCTYRLIETPMIGLGQALIRQRLLAVASSIP
jgi:peptidoglycan/LPS O-acetylase OafA/YrhL